MNINNSVMNINHGVMNINCSVMNINSSAMNINSSVMNINSSVMNINHSVMNINPSVMNINHSVMNINHSDMITDSLTMNINSSIWKLTNHSFVGETLRDAAMASKTYPNIVARNLALCGLGMMLNCITLGGVIMHADLTRSLRFALCSLVTTDLSFLLNIFVMTTLARFKVANVSCRTLTSISFVFVDCTALTLVVIAGERVLAVFHATWYRRHMNRWSKILPSVLLPWAVSVVMSTVSFLGSRDSSPPCPLFKLVTQRGLVVQGVLCLLAVVSVVAGYVALGVRFKSMARQLVVHPRRTQGRPGASPQEGRRTRKLTVHAAVLSTWFLLAYLPLAVFTLTSASGPDSFRHREKQAIFSPVSRLASSALLANSLVNPFLFFWRLVSFKVIFNRLRNALRRRLTAWKGDAHRSGQEVTSPPRDAFPELQRLEPSSPRGEVGSDDVMLASTQTASTEDQPSESPTVSF